MISRPYFIGAAPDDPVTHVDRCLFTSNDAGYGGAMLCRNVDLLMTSCDFVGNESDTQGGAVYLANGNPAKFARLANCTFLENTAADATDVFGQIATELLVYNSILWGAS
jgi:hypothetical protein